MNKYENNKKIRGFKSKWKQNLHHMKALTNDLTMDEIFFPNEFNHVKLSKQFKEEALNEIIQSFHQRINSTEHFLYASLWIKLDNILSSTIYFFKTKEELVEFYQSKSSETVDITQEYYLLELVSKKNIANEYERIVEKLKSEDVHYFFVNAKYNDPDELYPVYYEEKIFIVTNENISRKILE
ncbi:MAG: hypothetical protein ACRC17_03505 [Culicoidibacterales bacterium]